MRLLSTTILLLTVFLTIAQDVSANISNQMNAMFGSMTNVTNPQAHIGARRGVVSAGSMTVRNKQMTVSPLNISMPKIDSGCGGFDIYGGGFSFITADEMIQFLRSIGSSASSYAFSLALSSMCPSCLQIMNDLNSVAQRVNELSFNSCQIAKDIVDNAKGPLESIGNAVDQSYIGSLAGHVGTVTGSANQFISRIGKPSSAFSLSGSAATRERAYTEKLTGNIVWRVLTENEGVTTPAMNWFTFGGFEMAHNIMSLVGTFTVELPEGDSSSAPIITPWAPVLTFNDLVGSATHKEAITLYTCPDSTCLKPVVQTIPAGNFETMTAKVQRLLLGDGTGGSAGIARKFAYNLSEGLNTEEIRFIAIIPEHAKRIRDLAVVSPGSAILYANKISESVAIEIVQRTVEDIQRNLTVALSRQNHPITKQALFDHLKGVWAQMEAQRQSKSDSFVRDTGASELFYMLIRTANPRQAILDHPSPSILNLQPAGGPAFP